MRSVHTFESFSNHRFKMIHDQEAEAFKSIVDNFKQGNRYVVLLAPMQSGKSNTFKLVGAEMLRRKWVDRVVIFSGNREKSLFQQTKSHGDFKEAYARFLDIAGREEDEIRSAVSEVDHFEVVWGPDLKRFEPRVASKTLYIWEESHYGQTCRQQVDKFLTRVGMSASGESMPEGNYLLSVSATPFSELSDMYHFNQPKQVVRLVPGSDYISIQKMRHNGQLHGVFTAQEGLSRVLDTLKKKDGFLRKYALIRANKELQTTLASHIPSDVRVVRHDQSNVSDVEDPLNSMLSMEPDVPTIVFLKEMCRMGKRVNKTHVVSVMETSCLKTDTLAQSLLGRMCGYGPYSHIQVYLVNVNEEELDRLMKLHEGNLDALPSKGTNMTRSVQKQYLRTRMMGFPLTCGTKKRDLCTQALLEIEEDTLVDRNLPVHFEKIRDVLCTHLEASIIPSADRTEEEKVLAEHTKIHTSKAETLRDGLPRLREMFASGETVSQLGTALGVSPSHSEVVFYVDEERKYVYMVSNMEGISVSETTHNETFAPKNAQKKPLTETSAISILPITQTSSLELEKSITEWAETMFEHPELYNGEIRITANGMDCVWLDPLVYVELTGGGSGLAKGVIAKRLAEKGIRLHTHKKKGKRVECSCVRISEIVITVDLPQ
jgi:hypothetical protein